MASLNLAKPLREYKSPLSRIWTVWLLGATVASLSTSYTESQGNSMVPTDLFCRICSVKLLNVPNDAFVRTTMRVIGSVPFILVDQTFSINVDVPCPLANTT